MRNHRRPRRQSCQQTFAILQSLPLLEKFLVRKSWHTEKKVIKKTFSFLVAAHTSPIPRVLWQDAERTRQSFGGGEKFIFPRLYHAYHEARTISSGRDREREKSQMDENVAECQPKERRRKEDAEQTFNEMKELKKKERREEELFRRGKKIHFLSAVEP